MSDPTPPPFQWVSGLFGVTYEQLRRVAPVEYTLKLEWRNGTTQISCHFCEKIIATLHISGDKIEGGLLARIALPVHGSICEPRKVNL